MTERERIFALRARLRELMQQIEEHVIATANDPKRCPHRSCEDVCTFAYGCANRDVGRCSR